MEQTSSAGPVQIVTITEDHKFVLDEKKLKHILYNKRALGKKVKNGNAIFALLIRLFFLLSQIGLVSIAGDFRKGKSFILDFFLRYLRAKVKH